MWTYLSWSLVDCRRSTRSRSKRTFPSSVRDHLHIRHLFAQILAIDRIRLLARSRCHDNPAVGIPVRYALIDVGAHYLEHHLWQWQCTWNCLDLSSTIVMLIYFPCRATQPKPRRKSVKIFKPRKSLFMYVHVWIILIVHHHSTALHALYYCYSHLFETNEYIRGFYNVCELQMVLFFVFVVARDSFSAGRCTYLWSLHSVWNAPCTTTYCYYCLGCILIYQRRRHCMEGLMSGRCLPLWKWFSWCAVLLSTLPSLWVANYHLAIRLFMYM